MPEKDLLTVKEYAEATGVSQQAVYQRLNKSLSSYVVEVEGKKYLRRQALEEQPKPETTKAQQGNIEQALNNVDKLVETLSKTVELLQGQLEAKDQQINELNKRLEQALDNTSQSHFIAAQAQKPLASEEQPDIEAEIREEPVHEKGFFSRLFGRH